jgi:Allene oxide cyclase
MSKMRGKARPFGKENEMQRRFLKVPFSISAASLIVLSVGGLGLSARDADAKMTILNLIEHATTDAVTDTGAKGDSVGDLLTFANEVFDEKDAKKVGSDTGWCIRTVAGKSWECFWTLTLADGQITVEGPFLDAGDSVVAVTGGTGKYAGVRGEMALHARDAKGSAYDFRYKLMP